MLGGKEEGVNRKERKKMERERETRRGSTGVSNTGVCVRLQLCGVPGIQTHQRDQSAWETLNIYIGSGILTPRTKLWCLGCLQLRSCLPRTTWSDPAVLIHWVNLPSVGTWARKQSVPSHTSHKLYASASGKVAFQGHFNSPLKAKRKKLTSLFYTVYMLKYFKM